jgi:Tfp pilus assembly protein PilF
MRSTSVIDFTEITFRSLRNCAGNRSWRSGRLLIEVLLMSSFTLWLLVLGLASIVYAQQRIVEHRRVQVHVLDSRGGVRAKLNLRSANLPDFSTQTDGRGIGQFFGVPAGHYTLIVIVGGKEVYRDQLSLTNTELFRTEVVRLSSSGVDGPQVISLAELNVPKKANEHYMAAMKAIRIQDWERGLAALKKAIRVYPHHARAHNAMGVILALNTQVNEAEASFRRAIETNPKLAEPHYNLGKLLLESNRLPEARTELERHLELDGHNPDALALLINTMLLTHDEDSAVSLMSSVHRRNIQHASALHLEIASALEMHSRLEMAAEQYSFVLQEHSSQSEMREAEARLLRLKRASGPFN